MQSSPKLERRLNSSKLRFMKPGARHADVGRIVDVLRDVSKQIEKSWGRIGASIARKLRQESVTFSRFAAVVFPTLPHRSRHPNFGAP
jgi:hypothetical protein